MPRFVEVQRQFANHLRDPDSCEPPAALEDRRLQIYRDLIFNNIEGFISGGFPILKSLYSEHDWMLLVRDFVVRHRAHSPYFLKISEEFLDYLAHERVMQESDPAFMRELAHYEWVELALDISEEVFPADVHTADLLDDRPRVSPLAWMLSYQYPVHQLGPKYQPTEPPLEPTFLVVYRDRHDKVQFMATNAITIHLLNLLEADATLSGAAALQQLAAELQHPDPEELLKFGHELLRQLQSRDIIL